MSDKVTIREALRALVPEYTPSIPAAAGPAPRTDEPGPSPLVAGKVAVA